MKKLLVVLLVLGLAAPAMAQTNFDFYGELKTHLGYYHVSEDFAGGPGQDGTIAANGFKDEGTVLSMSGQTRLGMRAMVSDKVLGVAEFGFTETTRTGKAQDPYIRQAFGQWNFGSGKLLFGKSYTPGTFLGWSNMMGDIGDQGEAVMLVAGLPYIGRQPQLKLTVAGFEIALIEQNTGASAVYTNPNETTLDIVDEDTGDLIGTVPFTPAPGDRIPFATDIDRQIPRIELAYQFNTPMFTIRPILGYQVYKVHERGQNQELTVESYLAGLGVMLRLGPAYIKATGSWQQNADNYGNNSVINPAATQTRGRTQVDNAQTLQGTFVAGFRFSPTLGVEAGFGYAESKVDVARNVEVKHSGMVYYLQVPIVIAKGVILTPEIGQLDRGDVETDITGLPTDETAMGRMTYGMMSLKINF